MEIKISETKDISIEQIIELYTANKWSAAKKPIELHNGLLNSHSLVSAWEGTKLIGIGNAIHPDYQGKGIGHMISNKFQEKYKDFHMQMLTADGKAIDFYKKVGFEKAGETMPMWIYKGNEH